MTVDFLSALNHSWSQCDVSSYHAKSTFIDINRKTKKLGASPKSIGVLATLLL